MADFKIGRPGETPAENLVLRVQIGAQDVQQAVNVSATITQTAAPSLTSVLAGVTVSAMLASSSYNAGTYVASNGNPVTITPTVFLSGGAALSGSYTLQAGDSIYVSEEVHATNAAPLLDQRSASVTVAGTVTTTHSGTAIARRTNTLTPDLFGATITQVLTQPGRGTARPNYDGTLAYILVDDTAGGKSSGSDSFTFEVDRGGSLETHQMNVTINTFGSDAHAQGWYLQKLLSHALDGTGRIEVYPGPGHKDFHITAGAHGYTRAEIQAEAGQSSDSYIRNQNPVVYGSQAKPLHFSDFGGGFVRYQLWLDGAFSGSRGVYFERGYTYVMESSTAKPWMSGADGLNARHPVILGAWGGSAGQMAILDTSAFGGADLQYHTNAMYRDLRIIENARLGYMSLKSTWSPHYNVAFEGMETRWNVEETFGAQLRRVKGFDAWKDSPEATTVVDGNTVWHGQDNRIQTGHARNAFGLLLQECMLDLSGWEPGYHFNALATYPHPPADRSHSIYSDEDGGPFVIEGCIFSRGAYTGLNLRNGGLVMDVLLINNNAGWARNLYTAGKHPFTLLRDVWVTNAACRDCTGHLPPGHISTGIIESISLSGIERCVVSHWKDPSVSSEPITNVVSAPADFVAKNATYQAAQRNDKKGKSLETAGAHFHKNAVVYNWMKPGDNAYGSASTAAMDAKHIEAWAEAQPGNPADMNVDDVLAYLRTQDTGPTVKDVLDWALPAYGFPRQVNPSPGLMIFKPNPIGPGVHVEDAGNWDLGRRPIDGDTLNLYGHTGLRSYGEQHPAVLMIGDGGHLTIEGRWKPAAISGPGAIRIWMIGTLWMPDHSSADVLDIEVTEQGMLYNDGTMTGAVDLTVKDSAEVILASPGKPWTVKAGSTLRIEGTGLNANGAGIGFDGQGGGAASLTFEAGSTVEFVAAASGVSRIREFQSGLFGNAAPDVASSVALGGANLTLDLTNYAGTGTLTLIDVGSVSGTFNASVNVIGAGGRTVGAPQIAGGVVTVNIS